MSTAEERRELLQKLCRHLELVLRVHSEFQMSHTTQEVLDAYLGVFCRLSSRGVFAEFPSEPVADSQESVISRDRQGQLTWSSTSAPTAPPAVAKRLSDAAPACSPLASPIYTR